MPIQPQAGLASVPQARPFSLSGTLADLANIKSADLRNEQETLKLQAFREAQDLARRRQVALEQAGDDPRKWRQIVAQFDGPDALADYDKKVADTTQTILENEAKQQALYKQTAGFAAQILRATREAPDPVMAFNLARPSLQGMIPPDSGVQIPEATSPEDAEQIIAQLDTLARSIEDEAKQKTDAMARFDKGDMQGALATYLSLARSPEEWQGIQRLARLRDVPEELIAVFGDYTPENVERAKAFVSEAQKPSGGTSDYARFLERYAASLGKTAATLTADEELAGRKKFGQADDAARRPLAPVIVMGPQGPMVTTGSDRSQVTPIVGPDGKPLGLAPTASQRDRDAGLGRAQQFMDLVETLSGNINRQPGIAAKFAGTWAQLLAKANEDPDVAEYVSLVQGFVPMLARAVGHTGVLTEQDVERTVQLLPKPTDSAEIRNRKIANVRKLLGGTPSPGGGGASDPLGIRKGGG